MSTLTTTVRQDGPTTVERKHNAETLLQRKLAITESARERVRSKLIDVPIEDSPIKRDWPRRGRDEQLLSKIRGVSPASSVSSNEDGIIGRRPVSFLGSRTGRHKKTLSREAYAFPNEYSIPTIPLPPQDTTQHNTQNIQEDTNVGLGGDIRTERELLKPQSPARFRRRATSAEDTKNGGREISVRFELPESPPQLGNEGSDLFLSPEKLDIHSYPLTSTPNPSKFNPPQQEHQSTTSQSARLRQLDEEADAFDSAKSFLSIYQTPNSPSRGVGTPRFQRRQDSPSKLLRTLSRATTTPSSSLPSQQGQESFYHDASQYSSMPTPTLKGRRPANEEESGDEISVDEAERTLDEIISSADEAGRRVRRVLEQCRLERLERHSLSPPRSRQTTAESEGVDVTVEEDEEEEKKEMSVWGEKSFFRRMARKAPGGWAFTPQPKLGRTVDVRQEEGSRDKNENKENVKPSEETHWWEFWRGRRKEPLNAITADNQRSPPKPLTTHQTPPSSPFRSSEPNPQKPQPPFSPPRPLLRSPSKPFSPSPSKLLPSNALTSTAPLSTLSEKRLRLARSLHLLQSDIRLAREGIETLETRLENISLASSARQIDSERQVILRRQRGDPPPRIVLPPQHTGVTGLRGGTYVWLPFQRGWVIALLWAVLVVQGGLLVWGGIERRGRWEPYSFGEWVKDERWPI